MQDNVKHPLIRIICVLVAAALLLGQLTVNFAGIFADGGLYSGGTFGLSVPSVLIGAFTLAAVCAVVFSAAKFCKKPAFAVFAALAFVLRIVFVFAWKIEPESDFLLTYNLSELLAHTPFPYCSRVLDNSGTIYNGLWSAHMPFVIYQTIILRIFGNRYLSIQLVNAVFSAITCIFTADTARKISGEKAGFMTLFVMAVNPLSLFFVPVLTNQHAATCLFMAAVWVFYCKPVKNVYLNTAFCGVLTAMSHLLRPEMYVIIIAVAVIAVFGIVRDKQILKNTAQFAVYAVVFFIVLSAVNVFLNVNGITHQSILSGNLKYKLAVGLNAETVGNWSEADSELIFDEEKCGTVIVERLENPVKIIPLIIKKTAYQFGSYVYTWSMKDDFISDEIYRRLSSAVMAVIGISAVLTLLFADAERLRKLFPLIIILAGYMAVFAFIEVQPRYNYLLVPLIVILASDNILIRKKAE